MPRIRTIKPEFFCHEELFDLEQETGLPMRIAFAGLWTVCDREGRFKWRPRTIKAQVLPYDEVEFSRVLDALATRGFVVKYASDGCEFGYIPGFNRHQVINNREAASILPEPPEVPQNTEDSRVDDACPTRAPRVPHACKEEGKGKEGKGKEGEVATAPAPPEKVLTTFTCKGGQVWELKETFWQEMKNAYPRHDIRGECVKMKAWLAANESRRKTPQGMKRFIQGWLSKAEPSTPQQPADTRPRMPTIEEIGNARRAKEAAAAKRQAEVRSA